VYPEVPIEFPKKPVRPMTLTNTTKNTIQKRTERSEVHSQPKGVNPQDHSRTNLNQRLTRIHQRTGSSPKVLQELIRTQWETNFRPNWFITLIWNDLPTRFDTTEGHAKTFRNVFLTRLLKCNSPTKIPNPPARPQLVFFHERKPMITRGRQITAFNTHLHLGALPDPLNHLWYLDHLIHQEVASKVRNLLKTTSEGNKGVMIKPWVWDHHAFYNLKDYYRYKHHQDSDLVIDYQNSDLRF